MYPSTFDKTKIQLILVNSTNLRSTFSALSRYQFSVKSQFLRSILRSIRRRNSHAKGLPLRFTKQKLKAKFAKAKITQLEAKRTFSLSLEALSSQFRTKIRLILSSIESPETCVKIFSARSQLLRILHEISTPAEYSAPPLT